MGLLSGLLGHASEMDIGKLEKEFGDLLVPGETLEAAYKLVRDLIVFTSKRLILVDRQGVSGRKSSYTSIPYGSVNHFAIETAGSLDGDAELLIWVRGQAQPIVQEFKRGGLILEVHRLLAAATLK